jgi:hypothetical protein
MMVAVERAWMQRWLCCSSKAVGSDGISSLSQARVPGKRPGRDAAG